MSKKHQSEPVVQGFDLKVGPCRVNVVPMAEFEIGQDEECCGIYKSVPKTICLNTRRQPQEQAISLVHEVLHALWDVYSIHRAKDDEEDIISRLDAPLAGVLADNPLLIVKLHQALTNSKPIMEQ